MAHHTSEEFLDKFMHQKGRRFYAARLPSDIKRGKPGDCFDHCLMQALYSQLKYKYCEGKAYFNGKWFHHAWLTDEEGLNAYDPTWAVVDNSTGLPVNIAPAFVHYVGAAVDAMAVAEFVSKTEYKSPFKNADKNPELAQKVYDSAR